MTATLGTEAVTTAQPVHEPIGERRGRKRPLLPIIFWVAIVITMVPIFVMILYSFNNTPTSRITFQWHGFTTYWYQNLTQVDGLGASFLVSLEIAALSAIISLAVGVPLAMALERHRFVLRGPVSAAVFADIAAPSIVVGAASLSFFLSAGVPLGYLAILLVHVTFCIAYVVVVIRARLSGMGKVLEEAAGDLGANPFTAFWKVTFPLLLPGMLAGAALAFAMSIDDYVITSFVAGPTVTFPLFVYGAAKVGLPPQVLCFGTIVFVVALLIALLNGAVTRGRSKH